MPNEKRNDFEELFLKSRRNYVKFWSALVSVFNGIATFVG